MLISSPSGPCTMATLGVSVVKLKMLRPLLGSPSTASTPRRVALSDEVTSISGSAATVISCSCTACGTSANGTSSVSPSRRVRSDFFASRKPSARAAHVVGADPEQRRHVDAALVGGEDALGVGLRVPERHRGPDERAPPAESVIVPRMTPVVACACAGEPAGKRGQGRDAAGRASSAADGAAA